VDCRRDGRHPLWLEVQGWLETEGGLVLDPTLTVEVQQGDVEHFATAAFYVPVARFRPHEVAGNSCRGRSTRPP